MPELPEVEVVKRSLKSKIQNLLIKRVVIKDKNLRYKIIKEESSKLYGLKIIKIERRSKYLLFFFNKPIVMLVHLGMTGKFFFVNFRVSSTNTSVSGLGIKIFFFMINSSFQKNFLFVK